MIKATTCLEQLSNLQDGWSKMKSVEQQFKTSNEERLKMIAELRITGELNQQEFLSRLNDEKLQLEAQLNALSVLSKATMKNSVNAAIDVF